MKIYYFNDNKTIIKIGNNAKENQQLLNKSSQNDLWFHLHDNPSPHAIIHGPYDKIIINFAATMVKENSKFKNYKNIKVIYLERKNIKLTKKDGEVILKKTPNIISI